MKKIIIVSLCLLAVFLIGCSSRQLSDDAGFIEVKLHHDYADDVYLVYAQANEINEMPMDRISKGCYRVYFSLPEGKELLFNIKLTSHDYPGVVLWVGKASGIDAEQVSINDEVITNEFLVKTDADPAAAFSISSTEGNIIFGGGKQWNIDPRIPPELPQFHEYCKAQLPPQGFQTVLPWLQALQLYGEDEESLVEIDYMKMYAHLPTGDVLLYEDTYDADNAYNGFPNGGLYLRYPLLYDEQKSTWSMPASAEDGALLIEPGMFSDRVFHWWLSQRCMVPDEAEYVRMEARVRITGPACVQAGIDFWKDDDAPYEGLDVNNTEAGVSDVFFDDGSLEWQVIDFSTKNIVVYED